MNNHFEIKVPGGKLVAVDVDFSTPEEGGVINEVSVSGDFFIEPDEAFMALGPALQGASINEDAKELTHRLDQALSKVDGVAIHGFSTHDIAVAVRRAITGATDFTDHPWEVLRLVCYPPQ